jgi:hypothetical protein
METATYQGQNAETLAISGLQKTRFGIMKESFIKGGWFT